MKTLVIHPFDLSTLFLCSIYLNMDDCTVIRSNVSNKELIRLIDLNDRIIMLGHGTELGLIGFNKTKYVINSKHINLLKTKECICVWCNADIFVRENNLSCSLHTGMIVSDLDEAITYSLVDGNVYEASKNAVLSNLLLAKSIKEALINNDLSSITDTYKSDDNQIVLFNMKNIFIK